MTSRRLLAWYDRHRRDLPWRGSTTDPYRTLVSELMLQQTRVETVVPYFVRFIDRFPDVASLAEAPEREVLLHWAGLGYYKRARQLHQAARTIRASGFPDSVDGLRKLPGVGPYTAAAVASIAFGVAVPVVDGNVLRVGSRLLGRREIHGAAARRRLETSLAALLDSSRPGDSNQALMELGATVCTPLRPACARCPLRAGCAARQSGRPESFPRPRRKRRTVRVDLVAVWLADRRGRVRMFRRPESSALLGGSWELPWVERRDSPEDRAQGLAARYGGTWRLGEAIGEARHAITHRRLHVELVRGEHDARGGAPRLEARWVHPSQVGDLPRSSLLDKLLRCAVRAA